jgi:hypothetical protein
MDWLTSVAMACVPTLTVSAGWMLSLQRNRRALSSLHAQLESSKEENGRVQQICWEFQSANSAFAEEEGNYAATISGLQERIGELNGKLRTMSKARVQMRRHSVLMDGISGAGKSTLIERLTNPGATTAELNMIEATPVARQLEPVPLCWEINEGQRILHTLEFYDMGGEMPGHVIDNIRRFMRRRADEEAAGQAIALVVWDSMAELNLDPKRSNVAELNGPRLNAIYCNEDAFQAISSFVFFLNKVDSVQARLEAEGRGDEYEDFIHKQRRRLREEIFQRSLPMYPDPELAVGSALDGRGVHDCLGAIIRKLGLAGRISPRHP